MSAVMGEFSMARVVSSVERVRELPSPEISETERAESYSVLSLEALVRVKLNVFRRKDQVHLLDLLAVGLVDGTWTARYPPELAARLQSLIDDPDG